MRHFWLMALFLLISFGFFRVLSDEVSVRNNNLVNNDSKEEPFFEKERQEHFDLISERLIRKGDIEPIRSNGLKEKIEDGVSWCINNSVRADGWQLTGWSKVRLDSNFNPSRFKIGIISGEMEAYRRYGDNPDKAQWDEFERWQQQNQSVVFGIFWSKEF